MRIGNPPPFAQGSVVISDTVAPNTFTTMTDIPVPPAGSADIAADTTRRTIVLSNKDQAQEVYVRDQAATTAARGTRLAPLGVQAFSTTAAMRLTNAGAGTVTVSANGILYV